MSFKIIKYGNPIKGAEKSIKKGNLEIVMKVTSQAKALCPVDSGILRSSIMWKVPGQSGGHDGGNILKEEPDKNGGIVGTATDYAAYVEFGTRRQAAQPYLRPAVIMEVLGSNGLNTLSKATNEAMKEELNKK